MEHESIMAIQPMWKVGTVFETEFEGGCVMTTVPDEYGQFMAIDSDGVECGYQINMILPTNGSGMDLDEEKR
jgi:hypothetical protein